MLVQTDLEGFKKDVDVLQYNYDFEKFAGRSFYFYDESPVYPVIAKKRETTGWWVTIMPEMQTKIGENFENKMEKSIKEYIEKINPNTTELILDLGGKDIPVIFDLTGKIEVGLFTRILPQKIGRYLFGVSENGVNTERPFLINTEASTKNINVVIAMNAAQSLLRGKTPTDFGGQLLFLLSSRATDYDTWTKYNLFFKPITDVENSDFIKTLKEKISPIFQKIINERKNGINSEDKKLSIIPCSTFAMKDPEKKAYSITLDYKCEISFCSPVVRNIYYYPGTVDTIIIIVKDGMTTADETTMRNFFLELDYVSDVIFQTY